jgi:hypothetical protein
MGKSIPSTFSNEALQPFPIKKNLGKLLHPNPSLFIIGEGASVTVLTYV